MENGNEEHNEQLSKSGQRNCYLVEEEYEAKEVTNIAFEQEKTKVTLDDIFLLLTAKEKKERRLKIAVLLLTIISCVGILIACIRLLQTPAEKTATPQATENVVTATPTATPTITPTVKPTKKPTPKPTKKPKSTKKPTPKPTKVPVTEVPKPTQVPATAAPTKVPVTKAPNPTEKDVFEVEDPFMEE